MIDAISYPEDRAKLEKEIIKDFKIDSIFENGVRVGFKGDVYRMIAYCIDLELKIQKLMAELGKGRIENTKAEGGEG